MQSNSSVKGVFSTRTMVFTAMLIALTVVMMFVPGIGRIQLPIVSVTIAHIPILIAAIVFGFYPGLIVAFAFGATSLFIAATTPTGILDPYFVNPLISILPRLLIPVTAYFSYKALAPLKKVKGGDVISSGISVVIGNLTNTFGVYFMLYIVYARDILDKTGTPAISLIITAISTSTLIKCIVVVIITVPVIMAVKKAIKHM